MRTSAAGQQVKAARAIALDDHAKCQGLTRVDHAKVEIEGAAVRSDGDVQPAPTHQQILELGPI
jgi:hypothetical protein